MSDPCIKEATFGKFGTPVCCCPKCSARLMATMRRVFTRGLGDGPYLDWDYELADSYTNAEHGQ